MSETAVEQIEDAIRDLVQHAQIRHAVAEAVVASLGLAEEFREAADGGGSSWSTAMGRQGGSVTLPTRSRRFVTAWQVIRPRSTSEWSS